MIIPFLEVLFWLSVTAILYTYLIYPVFLIALSSIYQALRDTAFVLRKTGRRKRTECLPSVTLIIAAFNEQKCIKERVENLLELDYPPEKLTIIVGSDGSTDRTNQILTSFEDSRFTPVIFEQNRGKVNVLNDLIARSDTEITAFSDANTFFSKDALRHLVADFRRDDVGAVCGELELIDPFSGDNKDSLYWQYEQVLKFHESRINAMLGANGAIYAIRTALYTPLPQNTIIDDFCVFMDIARQGYKLTYNPEARATEEIAPNLKEESARRIRIGAGNYQAMMRLGWLLNPLAGWRSFSYISHKVIRWFVPHFMLLCLLANIFLAFSSQFYQYTALLQVLFYFTYLVGLRLPADKKGKLAAIVRLVTFFVSMNISLGKGFIRFMTTSLSATWERTAR